MSLTAIGSRALSCMWLKSCFKKPICENAISPKSRTRVRPANSLRNKTASASARTEATPGVSTTGFARNGEPVSSRYEVRPESTKAPSYCLRRAAALTSFAPTASKAAKRSASYAVRAFSQSSPNSCDAVASRSSRRAIVSFPRRPAKLISVPSAAARTPGGSGVGSSRARNCENSVASFIVSSIG